MKVRSGMLRHVAVVLLIGCVVCGSSALAAELEWKNVTGGVGGETWGYAGVTLMAAVPGSERVIACVSEKGVWWTDDGGKTWEQFEGSKTIKHRAHSITFDPKNSDIFWISGNYGPGLFKTTDGGKTWKQLGTLDHIDGLSVDLKDPRRKTMIVGQHEKTRSVHKSTNGGKTWKNIGVNLPEDSSFANVPFLVDSKTYLVNCSGWIKNKKQGLYRTADGGATWSSVSERPACGPAFRMADGTIYYHIRYDKGMIRSSDKGKTWDKVNWPVKGGLVKLPGERLAGLSDRLIFLTSDGGQTWVPVGAPLPFKGKIMYSEKEKAFYLWRSAEKKMDFAIARLALPEGLENIKSGGMMTVWDGDHFAKGSGWTHPKENMSVKAQTADAHNGKVAMEFKVVEAAGGWAGFGWNWHGWYPKWDGTDIRSFSALSFWIKATGKPQIKRLDVKITSNNAKATSDIDVLKYCKKALDGEWHKVVVPLTDLVPKNTEFDRQKAWEFGVGMTPPKGAAFSLFVDEIGFVLGEAE